jgi:hypothetical protein
MVEGDTEAWPTIDPAQWPAINDDADDDLSDDDGSGGSDVDGGGSHGGGGNGGSGGAAAGRQRPDYVVRAYSGHRNARTIKGVAFMGESDEYIVSGSDDGHGERRTRHEVGLFFSSNTKAFITHPTFPTTSLYLGPRHGRAALLGPRRRRRRQLPGAAPVFAGAPGHVGH